MLPPEVGDPPSLCSVQFPQEGSPTATICWTPSPSSTRWHQKSHGHQSEEGEARTVSLSRGCTPSPPVDAWNGRYTTAFIYMRTYEYIVCTHIYLWQSLIYKFIIKRLVITTDKIDHNNLYGNKVMWMWSLLLSCTHPSSSSCDNRSWYSAFVMRWREVEFSIWYFRTSVTLGN